MDQPKKSGYHKYNPFTQEVHHIKMAKVRKWEPDFSKDNIYLMRIWWNIDNSLEFYKKSLEFEFFKELEKVFLSTKKYTEDNFDQSEINEISARQNKNCDYKDTNLESIIELTQNNVKGLGIKIVRIDFPNLAEIN